MTLATRIGIVGRHLARSRTHLAFAAVGLVVGSASLVFFLALTGGIRERVLNRLYPVNQVELQREMVRVFGLGLEVPSRLDEAVLSALRGLPGVQGVWPKQKSRFQAILWGGREVFGRDFRVESFFDGIDPVLVRDEIRHAEQEAYGPEVLSGRCETDQDCGLGAACRAGACGRRTFWDRFRDPGGDLLCRDDGGCPPGEACIDGRCGIPCGDQGCGEGGVCDRGRCRKACGSDEDCLPGETCSSGAGGRACRRLECRLENVQQVFSSDPEVIRGWVVSSNPSAGESPRRCPLGTWCATGSVRSVEGTCEAPIPVILSPSLLEIYNRVVASAMGMQPVSGLEILLGVPFSMVFGESFFIEDAPVDRRVLRRCVVVGFSNKALDFGFTVPLGVVVRANAMMRGREGAAEATSVILETARNEDLAAAVEDAKVLGLVPAPRSEEARKASQVLRILSWVFGLVSGVMLVISSIHITHTFLMLLTERRLEIAVYRAVGARLSDIRAMVFLEAGLLGVFGGGAGTGLAWLLAQGVNRLPGMGGLPGLAGVSRLFDFSPGVLLAGVACAEVFALVGAWLPAARAARMDPAAVLS